MTGEEMLNEIDRREYAEEVVGSGKDHIAAVDTPTCLSKNIRCPLWMKTECMANVCWMGKEIERREYYDRKERGHLELVDCMVTLIIWTVIALSLLSITRHVRELWKALADCF